jgi:hypothetical protein
MSLSTVAEQNDWQCLVPSAQTRAEAIRPCILAPSVGLEIPTLEGIPAHYIKNNESDHLTAVVEMLLRAGAHTTPFFQRRLEGQFPAVQELPILLLESWLASLCPKEIADQLHLFCAIRDQFEDGSDLDHKDGIIFTVEAVAIEDLIVGNVLEALEQHSKGLGADFYLVLEHALGGNAYYYGHDEAMYFEEMVLENIAESCEDGVSPDEYMAKNHITTANPLQYLPECLKVKCPRRSVRLALKRLRSIKEGIAGSWCQDLIRMNKLATAFRALRSEFNYEITETLGDSWDDGRPLPHWVLQFSKHDAISEYFDEEGQTWNQCSHAPDFFFAARYDDAAQMDVCLALLKGYVQLQAAMMALIHSIRQWQSQQ